MKVLIVTSVFPNTRNPYSGLYVKEQIDSVKIKYPDVMFSVYFVDHGKGRTEYLKSIYKINSLIKKNSYDIVHVHYGIAGMFLLNPFRVKIPTIVTFHGSDIQPKGGNGFLSELISKEVAKKADAVIVLNNSMQLMVDKYNKKSSIIPCAVNLNIFKRPEQIINNKQPIIVFPSNRERGVKNYPLFCEVLTILRNEYGINPIEKEVKNMSRSQVAELFSNSNLLLMTSKSEGSPQAIKEAMACNLPCVSTPVGDVNVLLDGVRDSYVAKEHNAIELAALVNKSLLKKGNGISGREKCVMLGIDSDSVADKIYCLYQNVIKNS